MRCYFSSFDDLFYNTEQLSLLLGEINEITVATTIKLLAILQTISGAIMIVLLFLKVYKWDVVRNVFTNATKRKSLSVNQVDEINKRKLKFSFITW